jgi:hypothetical protein
VAAQEVMKSWRRNWKFQDAVEQVAAARRPPSADERETD